MTRNRDPYGAYAAKVRRGERPSGNEAEAFLRAWHARHPDATSCLVNTSGALDRPSSYDLLAACIPDGSKARVLDLACGDGKLSARVHARLGPDSSLAGIDISEESLVLARARGLHGATFRCERAQAISAPDGSFDVVLCHYALMLMSSLSQVVLEVARVLRPGGLFASLVPTRWSAGFSDSFTALLREVRTADLPSFPDMGLGDDEFHARGLEPFLTQEAGFTGVEVERHVLTERQTLEQLWQGLRHLYWFDLLSPTGQTRLEEEGRPLLQAAAGPDGRLPFSQEVVLVRARRMERAPFFLSAPRIGKWTRASTERVGRFRVFDVDHHQMRDPGGAPRGDVYTFECPDWCNVIALTPEDDVLMVWQYRHGTDGLSLEIPGGVVEAGETPAEAARRELREETGYETGPLEPLLVVEPNPALQNNRCHTFVARGARLAGPVAFDETEECEVVRVPARFLGEMLDRGAFSHSLVVCALERFLRTRKEA